MKSSNVLTYFIFFIIGVVVLAFIANKMISEGSLPSFQKYMDANMSTVATSTLAVVTSTSTLEAANLSPTVTIYTASSSIDAFVADNEATRERGLGGVVSLNDNEGMLFIFDQPNIPNFWMKDMNIPLDMVWIDENKTVVGVADNISTSTYPETFSPTRPILYVLEINSGAAKKLNIISGTKLRFDPYTI